MPSSDFERSLLLGVLFKNGVIPASMKRRRSKNISLTDEAAENQSRHIRTYGHNLTVHEDQSSPDVQDIANDSKNLQLSS